MESLRDELEDEVVRMAAAAVENLQERAKGRLDYTPSSLAAIEEILAEAAGYRDKLSEEQVQTIAQMVGCYILEVGRRDLGGDLGGGYYWHENREQPILVVGEPDFHVALMTWDKVRGRLRGDAADSIPFFYDGFAERARQAEPGVRALYG
jgi:hypothetical protein